MLWIAVQSKLISEIAYDESALVLHVRLRNGQEISHDDVAPQMVENLLTADSPGFYYSFYIAKKPERREHQTGVARLSSMGARVGKSALERIDLPLLQQRIQRMRAKLHKLAKGQFKRLRQHDLPKIVARMQRSSDMPAKARKEPAMSRAPAATAATGSTALKP